MAARDVDTVSARVVIVVASEEVTGAAPGLVIGPEEVVVAGERTAGAVEVGVEATEAEVWEEGAGVAGWRDVWGVNEGRLEREKIDEAGRERVATGGLVAGKKCGGLETGKREEAEGD